MSVAETLRDHAWAALRMAEQASEEDRSCLVSLAQTWFKQTEQAAKEHQPTPVGVGFPLRRERSRMTDDPRKGARTLAARYRSTAAAARRRAVKLGKRKLNEVAEKYEMLARCAEEMVDHPRPNPTDKQSW
jgi:hypothetical protein